MRPILPRLARTGLAALPVAAGAYWFRRPLPRIRGRMRLDGLRSAVEVCRDEWGVPHIYASSALDALYAQGFVHAQDRLWQMELSRRIGYGRLSEVVGRMGLEADRLLRTLRLAESARRDLDAVDDGTRAELEAYSAGVNACMRRQRGRLPLEFRLTLHRPEPWQPLDTMVWAKVMAWGLSFNWAAEVLNAALLARLGPDAAARLLGDYPASNPSVIPGEAFTSLLPQLHRSLQDAASWLPLNTAGMSNNWVVDGSRTATGRPLLENDPHLQTQMPSYWYEIHLVAPDLEVAGVSLPGAPGVVLGHNARIAWGMTAALADVQDLYVERLHPDDPDLYEYEGRWERVQVVHEEIHVRGERRVQRLDVRSTRHGPLVNDLSSLSQGWTGAPLALRWTSHDLSYAAQAALCLNRASDWDEFVAALEKWTDPPVSVVYADVDGNIGFHMAGRVPVRAAGDGRVPAPGWTGTHEWTGWVPHRELPHAYNPACGYLASANNAQAGADYPYHLASDTCNGYRASRIVQLLGERPRLTVEQCAAMQIDQFCAPGSDFAGIVKARAGEILASPALESMEAAADDAVRRVAGWDGMLLVDSVAGSLYEAWLHFAQKVAFEPALGPLAQHFMGKGLHPLMNSLVLPFADRTPLVLIDLLRDDDASSWQSATGHPLTSAGLLGESLAPALRFLQARLGSDPERWRWGRLHRVLFPHMLGRVPPIGRIFNRGPYPYGGDMNTVWQAAFAPEMPPPPSPAVSASWRMVLDVGDWDAGRGVLPGGQSGHPASPHYNDQMPLWLRGELRPLLWSRPAVDANTVATLWLEPE